MSKNLIKSKTFWLNLLGIATTFIPIVPLNPETLVYVLGGLNIVNRLITDGPVHVLKNIQVK